MGKTKGTVKITRKILCVLFVIFLLTYPSTATAANINSESEIEYFDDGSYIITTIDNLIQIIGKLHQNQHLKAETLQVLKEWRKGIMAERLSKLLLKMSS